MFSLYNVESLEDQEAEKFLSKDLAFIILIRESYHIEGQVLHIVKLVNREDLVLKNFH
jgi:hypothetical protein